MKQVRSRRVLDFVAAGVIACSGLEGCSWVLDFDGISEGAPPAATGGSSGSAGSGGTAGITTTSGTAATGGAGGSATSTIGCSDGSREGYEDQATYPDIAACAGAFRVAGVTTQPSMVPACGRKAGNDGAILDGAGCSVEDLCAEGWHVCRSNTDVLRATRTCIASATTGFTDSFWLTRQIEAQDGSCATIGANNVVGCGLGTLLTSPPGAFCEPLNAQLSTSTCPPPWNCGTDPSASFYEGDVVTKTGPAGGGLLCCKGL